MQTNGQNTLVIMFQHVNIFFTMLDYYSEQNKSIVGFRISTYENVLGYYCDKHIQDKNDRRRVLTALSIKNMEKCGLLSLVNDNKGVFSLQKCLLQTIQNLDSKRIRELGQPDLDIIYAQIKTLYDYFSSHNLVLSHFDSDVLENLSALTDTLQEVFSKIDHNVKALEGSSKRLSEIVDSHDFNKKIPTKQVNDALDEIIRIYRRNIKPTLTFLNEKAMTRDSSAMFLIRRIREILERTTFHKELNNIVAIEMKLLSFSEVINDIRRKLSRYIDMSVSQRKIYNEIEVQFNDINNIVISLLDSKLTGKQLSYEHDFFKKNRCFTGLNNWLRTSLTAPIIELPENFNKDSSLEYIRTKLDRVDVLESKKRLPSKKSHSAAERRARQLRVGNIKIAMKYFDTSVFIPDLYLAIHQHFLVNLKDYELKDVYDALPFVSKQIYKKNTLIRREIIHLGKVLSYTVKELGVI